MRPTPSSPNSPHCARRESPHRAAVHLLAGVMLIVGTLAVAFDAAHLRQQLTARFGTAHVELLDGWLQTVLDAQALAEPAKLKRINDFVNRRIVFEDDRSVWDQSDYWATPLETIGQGRGDCEDFAIIKYVSLRRAGVANDKLRLIYVKATLKTPDGPIQVAHMVLAYYATPNAEPLLLDNLEPVIRPASQRADLKPVFSFNSAGIFAGVSGKERATNGGIGRLSRWEDVWRRILAEGYE
ncbi:MAG: transglutaminase-like cysteine peptidase [Propionivibrio sp.]